MEEEVEGILVLVYREELDDLTVEVELVCLSVRLSVHEEFFIVIASRTMQDTVTKLCRRVVEFQNEG